MTATYTASSTSKVADEPSVGVPTVLVVAFTVPSLSRVTIIPLAIVPVAVN